MRLKRSEDVVWLELPKVESPHLARSWAESNIPVSGQALQWVQGLEDVVWDDCAHNHNSWDSHARERLLQRIETGEVLLVHDHGSEPVMPVVHSGTGDKADDWSVDTSLNFNIQLNLQRTVDHAYTTRGIWSQVIVPRKEAPKPEPKKEEKKELSVTNPRWEHVDEKRKENSPDSTVAGDTVTLMVDVSGASDGTRVTFKIFDTSISPPSRVGAARGKVEGGIGKGEWKVKVNREGPELEFEGDVRRVTSERAEIPVVEEFKFVFSF